MPAKTLKVGDLVQVPPIRTVIQLDHLADAAARDEILGSFVFTGEVTDFLTRLLQALREPTGLGCFLKGPYGSGKSHCLAFLDRLLRHDPQARLAEDLPAPEGAFLPVTIPLLAFPAAATLERIVMDALAEALHAETGQHLPLSDRGRFLAHFRELILPRHPLQGFAELDEAGQEQRALEFLRTLPDNPLRMDYDRRKVLQALPRDRKVVLILDELSEFLRSKPSDSAFNEDIRYLQFLGEWSQHAPLWIVAGLQETLEEVSGRELPGYQKIKERYPLRYNLSARHVTDLLEGRILKRRPGSETELDRLHSQFDEAFPGLATQREFRRSYPVHPTTLELLESLMPLFSRHRGVVDFVHARLAGDPLKGAPGMLDEPADRLLTADAIFDHFQERIRETPELSAYDRVAWSFLEKDVPRLFPKERDRELALRLVKLLVLAEISPVPQKTTAEWLARTLARRISVMSPELNVEYVRENLLQALVTQSSFVARHGELYRLDLNANAQQVMERRVRDRRRDLQPDWGEAAARVNRPALPLAELAGRAPSTQRLRWQNTSRAGLVSLRNLATLPFEDFAFRLTQLELGEEDFALFLAPPGPGQDEAAARLLGNAKAPGLVFWLPAPPDADLEDLLLEETARRLVAAEDPEAGRHLESSLQGLGDKLDRSIAELYFAGRLVHLQGSDPAPREPLGWERTLLEAVRPRLEAAYPRHAEVAPETDLTKRGLDLLWEGFLASGRCAAGPQEPTLLPYLLRLGLAERRGAEVVLAVDPTRTPLLKEILDRLLPQEKLPLADLERALRKGPFGASRPLFAILVAALVQAGRATPYGAGRAMPLDSLDALLNFRVEALGPGRLLDESQRHRLEEVAWLWPGEPLAPFTPARQRELWRVAGERLAGLGHAAEEVRRAAAARAGSESLELLPLEALQAEAERVHALVHEVGQPAGAEVGLKRLAASPAGGLEPAATRVERWAAFLRRHLREFQETWMRLQEMGAPELLEPLAAAEDPAAVWEGLREAFLQKDADYRQAYVEEHEAWYEGPAFRQARELQGSPQWQAAERLSGVLGLESRPTFPELRRQLEALPARCRRRVADQLLLSTRCACGFQPGQPAPEAPDLRPQVHLHLIAACTDLTKPRNAQRLEAHLRGLRQVGQDALARRVEEALAAAADVARPSDLPGFWPRAAARLAGALDRPVVEALNRALTGRALVVRRNPADLLKRLEGQRLPPDRLRRAFEEWLRGEGLPEDAWIHVAGAESDRSGAWLKAWLDQHGLVPDERMRRRVPPLEGEPSGDPREAEEELRRLGVLDEAAAALDPVRGACAERLFPGVSRDLCRRALRQAVDAPEAARALVDGLPALDWDHGEVARAAAATWLHLHENPLLASRDWARATHLDMAASFLPPDVEESTAARLRDLSPAVEALPLARVVAELVPATGPAVVLLVDALRWDLWDLLRPMVVAELGQPTREAVAEAPLPTVTSRGRSVLLEGPEEVPPGYDAVVAGRPARLLKSADERGRRAEALDLLVRLGSGEGLTDRPRRGDEALVLHLAFVDRRVHESRLDLWPLFTELLEEARMRLVPLLRAVPREAAVLLTADHGFRTAAERHAHGGATWSERLVPAVAWGPRA